MPRQMRSAVTLFLACLPVCMALLPAACFSSILLERVAAAEADAESYGVIRQRMLVLESLEDREKKKEGYDDIIARYQDSGDPKIQWLAARAMLERVFLNVEEKDRLVALDEMIAKYGASENDDIRAEAIAAKLAKATLYSWPSKLADKQARKELYDDIIVSVGDNPNESMQRMAARAMFEKQYCVSGSDYDAVLRDLIERYGSSADVYVRRLVAEAMDRLAKKVATEAEKNAILRKIVAAYQSEEDGEVQAIVVKAREGITGDSDFDAIAVNSYRYSFAIIKEGVNPELRQAWRCKTTASKYGSYSDIIKKYRHMKHKEVRLVVVTALIERSFLDMTGGNEEAVACLDNFAATAPDYGSWLLFRQNRLWFARGRVNILAELDALLDPGRKDAFDSNRDVYFREASIGPAKIDAILAWARQLRTSLSQGKRVIAKDRPETAAPDGGDAIGRGEAAANDESMEARNILARIVEECGESPERLAQYHLFLAMEKEAALLGEGTRRNAFWRGVIDKFKAEKSVYARHHVIAGYAKLIAAADGEEKTALLDELADLLDASGTFRELQLLEDIRAGRADFPMPLLFRNW